MIVGPYPTIVTTDDAGRVLTVDGAYTTQHIMVQRQDDADVPAMATMFAQRGGILSARDTVNAISRMLPGYTCRHAAYSDPSGPAATAVLQQ